MPRASTHPTAHTDHPDDEPPDTGPGAVQRIVRTPAATAAPRSVFDLAGNAPPPPAPPFPKRPKAPRRPMAAAIDPAAITVHSGRPLPPVVAGTAARGSRYAVLFGRMQAGDMVELTDQQATAFVSWGKKHKHALTRRRTGPGTAGVWRTA